jgi:hypothetical protein
MDESKLVALVTQTLDLLEEQIRQNFALTAIVVHLGVTHVDDAIRKVLSDEDAQKGLQKALFQYRSIREDIDRTVTAKRGEVPPPLPRAN